MARKNKKQLLEQYKNVLAQSRKIVMCICKHELKNAAELTNEKISGEIKSLKAENDRMLSLLNSFGVNK